MIDWQGLYAARMGRVVASDIRERMKLLGQPGIVHLGGGLPEPSILPREAIAAATAKVLDDPASARIALPYAPSEGHAPLKEWVAGYMGRLGAPCGPQNILVTNGSQQALDFISRLLVDKGDRVTVERPTFIGALRAFDAYEASYTNFPEQLEDPAAVRAALRGAKFAYLGPEFRNPTGTCLSLAERHTLLDAAAAEGTPVVEDGCYETLRFEGTNLPALLALELQRAGGIEKSNVLYTGTFSKTLAPSLRTGWIVGPEAVIRKLVLIKQAADLATSALLQMVALDVASTRFDECIARALPVYRARRDAMLDGLAKHMPAGVDWTRPAGGFYLWMTLPEDIDGGALANRALAEEKLSVIAGAAFYPVDVKRNTLRLSYSMASEEQCREGARRLGEVLRRRPN